MESATVVNLVVLLLAILLSAFIANTEGVLAALRGTHLRQMLDAAPPDRARQAQALFSNRVRLLSTLMALRAIAFVGIIGPLTALGLRRIGGWPGLLVSWAVAALVVLLSQVIPRARVLDNPERAALRLMPPLSALAALMAPLVYLLRGIAERVYGAPGNGALAESIFLSDEGLRLMLHMATDEETSIEEEEREMIGSILELDETVVREVMVPRIDVVAVEVQTPILQAVDVILDAGHSRLPVYQDTVDNVVGVVYAKDLLRALRSSEEAPDLTSLLRTPYFVPETKKVNDLLAEMRKVRVHMAIVVDEYGGIAGLVTIEDLVEEIVGEIQDEYDQEEPRVQQVGDGEYIFDARIPLDVVSQMLNVPLPEDSGDTLGGLIYSHLGRVPVVGDELELDKLRINILSIDGRRIQQVRVELLPAGSTHELSPVNPNAQDGAAPPAEPAP